jgi:serine/threonine protein kinase/tetratricopeptide (TPR) repeat protein
MSPDGWVVRVTPGLSYGQPFSENRSQSMPFAIGENVGAYRIVEKLGQGGMATVFKAYHPALDRYVAIKVMHPAFTEDPNFLARFQREARIVAKLDHPHIVPIYDFAEHKDHPYLVMRFVEGKTLKARLRRETLDTEQVLRIVRAVGKALTYAHGQGVLHRDIKPSNVLLTPEGGVYLTDFGLARMAEAGESTLSRDMMVGTPQYISPEQAKGVRELDARTDIYSLGVVLYEMLVGQAPFTADTPYAIIHDHIFTPLPLPRELNPDLPEPLERVLLRALAKDPDDRFQSVEELVNALEETLGPAPTPPPPATVVVPQETVVAMPPTPPSPPEVTVPPPPSVAPPTEAVARPAEEQEPRKKKHGWLWAVGGVGALLCLAVAVVGLLVLLQPEDEAPPTPENVAEQLLEEARIAQEAGDPEHALELYRQAREVDPYLIPAYLEASEVLVRMGDMDAAIDILMAGIEATDDPGLHKHLAGVALLTRRLDIAEKEMRWLQQEAPEQAFSHAYAGLFMLAQGEPCEMARPELDSALLLDPELVWAHYGLAICYLQEGHPEAARPELEFVLGQESTPLFLRKRAEEMLVRLDEGGGLPPDVKEIIEREFEELFPLAGEIRDEGLRTQFKDMLSEARRLWEEGDDGAAIDMLIRTHTWVKEHYDEIGDPPAEELDKRIDHIIRLATEPGPPP